MAKVGLVGIGTLPWQERNAEQTFRALAASAAKKALADAGIGRRDIDFVVYSIFSEVMLRQQIPTVLLQDYLGFQGLPSYRVEGGSASEGYALHAAYAAIASGRSEIALLVAVQKGSDFYDFVRHSRESGYWSGISNTTDATWLQPVMPCSEALLTTSALQPHIERYGNPTPAQLAAVVVKNRAHAARNPEAQCRDAVSVEEVLASPPIAGPTTALMRAARGDAACAIVLASEAKARALAATPIWLAGTATSSYPTHRAGPQTLGRLRGTQVAAEKAYRMAGIADPARDVDLVQIHDLISGVEILAYEELGLCAPGEGGRLVDEGVVALGGRLPCNVDGGRIGCGHAGGVSGAYAACEIVRQLRETAGDRQVPLRTGRALLQCMDSHGAMSSVSVFSREGN